MGDTIIAVIWVVFMIIAAISAIMKKAKQQQEMQARESAGEGAATKSKPAYAAPEEDIRAFLEQIGAKQPPIPVESPAPERPRPARQPQPVRSQRPQRKKPRKSASLDPWIEEPVVKAKAVSDPLMALTGRLSPIQRAVVWREILDSPPGLSTGAFAREA